VISQERLAKKVRIGALLFAAPYRAIKFTVGWQCEASAKTRCEVHEKCDKNVGGGKCRSSRRKALVGVLEVTQIASRVIQNGVAIAEGHGGGYDDRERDIWHDHRQLQ
jgi:hypothetical protein